LPKWKERYWEGHVGMTIGFEITAPRVSMMKTPGGGPAPPILGPINMAEMDTTLMLADYAVHTLRDSMGLMTNEMRNLMTRLSAMEQHSKFLEDSLKAIRLNTNVDERKMNNAMRHLSRSLRYFYAGNYRTSLQEVESALELNPNLALAYARRGSIYYKLGDIQRATINWNLALRMDPEYDDVRNVLKALHENRLKSTSMIKD
jgi:tetratricopeptide (TPR) repeat protein